jgi:hypothetical protein
MSTANPLPDCSRKNLQSNVLRKEGWPGFDLGTWVLGSQFLSWICLHFPFFQLKSPESGRALTGYSEFTILQQ